MSALPIKLWFGTRKQCHVSLLVFFLMVMTSVIDLQKQSAFWGTSQSLNYRIPVSTHTQNQMFTNFLHFWICPPSFKLPNWIESETFIGSGQNYRGFLSIGYFIRFTGENRTPSEEGFKTSILGWRGSALPVYATIISYVRKWNSRTLWSLCTWQSNTGST